MWGCTCALTVLLVLHAVGSSAAPLLQESRAPVKEEAAARSAQERIINGQPVVPGQNPDVTWQVGVLINNGEFLCGGSIVASDMILTAGHCVKDITSGTITDPGLVVATPGVMLHGGGSQTGNTLWVHPSYDNSVQAQDRVDLALVQMASPFTMSSSVTTIPLATPNCSGCESKGAVYVVSGYGTTVSTTEGSSDLSNQLLYVYQTYVQTSTCQEVAPFALPTTSVCTSPIHGQSNTDSCQGDSGGPLAWQTANGFILAGAVSTGTAVTNPLCGVTGQYGVYVSVSRNYNWISSTIATRQGGVVTTLPPGGSSSIPWYYYVPAIIGGVILLIILIACCCCGKKSEKRDRQQIARAQQARPVQLQARPTPQQVNQNSTTVTITATPPVPQYTPQPQMYAPQPYMAPPPPVTYMAPPPQNLAPPPPVYPQQFNPAYGGTYDDAPPPPPANAAYGGQYGYH